jgi:peroxiredoxin
MVDDMVADGGRRGWARRIALTTLVAMGSATILARLHGEEASSPQPPAPNLTKIGVWINSKPLTLSGQRGKVVVLHFWTFGCINCRRNLPYYNRWREGFAEDELQIIGVHTPDTVGEADEAQLISQVEELGIKYPVAVDNDRATWKAYQNRYWPSIYLIDKQGRIRFRWDGELEHDAAGGDKLVRAKVQELLAEAGP